MNLPALPLIDGCLFIDNSTLELLTTCPRAMEYNYLHRRKLNAERSALSFGSAIHLAMEHRYRHYPHGSDMTAEHKVEVREILRKHFEQFPCPIDDHRTLDLAIQLVDTYNQRTLIEPFKVMAKPCDRCDEQGKVTLPFDQAKMKSEIVTCPDCFGTKLAPLVEMPFAVKMTNFIYTEGRWCPTELERHDNHFELASGGQFITLYYTGRIDLVVEWDGGIWPFDHKTTSMMGPTWGEEMNMSPQQEGYAWAIKKVMGVEPPGAIINGIRVRRPAKTVAAVVAEDFQRLRSYFEPGGTRLVEWERNTIALVEEFLWHHSRDYMPQKKKWCVGKYGRCQYYDICSLPPQNRVQMLGSNIFTNNEWSPLKKVNH